MLGWVERVGKLHQLKEVGRIFQEERVRRKEEGRCTASEKINLGLVMPSVRLDGLVG